MRAVFMIFFIAIAILVRAQDINLCSCDSTYDKNFKVNLKGQVFMTKPGIAGKEYFIPAYLQGTIFLTDGTLAEDVQIRYNGRIDGLLLLPYNSGKEILLDKYFINEFWLKNDKDNSILDFKKIYVTKDLSNDSVEIFGQTLFQDKLSLFVLRRYVHQKDIMEHINNSQISIEFYGPSFIYYYQLPNHRTIAFKSFKKKDFYKLFPDDKEMMKKLFKQQHQKRFKNEEDLIKITKLLNSLFT
jgi:hypothetical protein